MTTRKFGAKRDVHDGRDYRLRFSPGQQIAETVDLREWAGPIKNQQTLGSCTGHGFSSAREWIARRYEKLSPVLSPLFIYSEELIAEGDFPNDEGAQPRTGCQVITKFGVCEDSLYPDASLQIKQPTAEMLANALKYKTGAYHRLSSLTDVLCCLSDPTPWPVLVAFQVYESFESQQVADTGIMPVPSPGEQLLGGHEVLCLGFDRAKQLALIQNSWGDGWGQKGYFWMPFPVLASPDSDLWMVHTGKPWK